MYDPNQITYFGETDYRGEHKKFGIKAEDRTRHMYVIGKTGMGKSTLLENMAVQDIQQGMSSILLPLTSNILFRLTSWKTWGETSATLWRTAS
jgi:ATPase subunit of ABC transporter with duplicated ATPase domains